jgi:hypothetical protein
LTITCGIDWAESHHDVALVDASGKLVAKRRISDDAEGFRRLLELLSEAGDTAENPIPVAVETARGLLICCLRVTGRAVYSINPMAVARRLDAHPAPPTRRPALERGRTRPSQRRDRARPPRDPHPQGRHHRRGHRVPTRPPGRPDPPTHPPDLRSHRSQGALAHRDRLRDHRPRPTPGPTRRNRQLDPRALAHRERAALGAGCDLRRGPVPDPYWRRPAGHGLAPQPCHQPAPPRRRHQHRQGPTTSRP